MNFLLVQYIYNLLQILFQTSRLGSPQLEATFDTIIEVFMFLDKNGNGKLNKKDMVKALNETSPWEKSPSHITKSRFSIKCFTGYSLNFILFLCFIVKFFCFGLIFLSFPSFFPLIFVDFLVSFPKYAEEMDWDKNGKVSFREFLFAFINWVGIDMDEDMHQTGT